MREKKNFAKQKMITLLLIFVAAFFIANVALNYVSIGLNLSNQAKELEQGQELNTEKAFQFDKKYLYTPPEEFDIMMTLVLAFGGAFFVT